MTYRSAASLLAVYSSTCVAQPCQVGWRVSPIGNPGTSQVVRALTAYNDGTGSALYASGPFLTAGGVTVNSIAKWNGTQWSALGSGAVGPVPTSAAAVNGLGVYNDGTGAVLIALGNLISAGGVTVNRVGRWNGNQWSTLGSGFDQATQSMAVFNDGSGPALYVGGSFTSAIGVPATSRIAKWNGTQWSTVGGGMDSGSVNVLYTYNDGSGNALYAGGTFTMAGGVAGTARIARWNGQTWSALGGGMDGSGNPRVNTLIAFGDTTGNALYAGGLFSTAGGQSAENFAKWQNGQWTQAGGGTDGNIIRMEVFDDGRGPALYVGGAFLSGNLASPVFVNQIGRWDGQTWEDLNEGVNHPTVTTVSALAVVNDGSGDSLFVAGGFTTAGGQATSNIARWGCAAPPPCYANCDASTIAPTLNVGDFTCFLNRYAAADTYANCDHSTVAPALNVADFICFLNAYAAGCR